MNNTIKTSLDSEVFVNAGTMPVNRIGIIRKSPFSNHVGKVVMKVNNTKYDILISLNDGQTWTDPSNSSSNIIELLPEGTKIELTVKYQ